MPTTADESLNELAVNSNAAHLAAQPNDCYQQNYNRFCRWIDQQEGYDTDDHGRYITRENVDLYFSCAIPNYTYVLCLRKYCIKLKIVLVFYLGC